jgi:hypothetical protein
MPRIPFTHNARENLAQFVHWIPWITLVKNYLASWHKKRVHDGEELRSVDPVEKVHCNHVVEVPTGKRAGKVRGRQDLYFRADIRWDSGGLLESHRCDPVFSPGDLQERVREETFAAAELENSLARQEVNRMPKCLGTPQQTIRGNRIMLSPIIVAISFPDSKCRMKRSVLFHRYRFHHWIDGGSCLAASPLKE